MRIIKGTDLGFEDINFPLKVIDIDFYNVTRKTLFFGHTNDNNFTVLHLIVPEEYREELLSSLASSQESEENQAQENNSRLVIKASFYNKTLDKKVITVPVVDTANEEFYLFLTNGDILNSAYNGELQFFIIRENIRDAATRQLVASSNKISYIVEESLSLETSEDVTNVIQSYASRLEGMIEEFSAAADSFNGLENRVESLENYSLSFKEDKVDNIRGFIVEVIPTEGNSNNKSRFFFSTLGALKVQTKPKDEDWLEDDRWLDFETTSPTELTQEMVEKIDQALTAIPADVERNTNKITSIYSATDIQNDTTHYPSMAAMYRYIQAQLNNFYDELYELDFDGKADKPSGNGVQSFLNQIIITDSSKQLLCSGRQFGNNYNFSLDSNQNLNYIPTEQSVINYVEDKVSEHKDFATFNNLKEISDDLAAPYGGNFFLLEDTNESVENFKLTIVNNHFTLNGTLNEDTTFTINCKDSGEISLIGNESQIKWVHLIFYDMYDKNNNIIPISGNITYDLPGYPGTPDLDFNSNLISNRILNGGKCYLASKNEYSSNNTNLNTISGNSIEITLGAGTYDNETFNLIAQFTRDSINRVINNIAYNEVKTFNINEDVLPEKITDLPGRADTIESNINAINTILNGINTNGTTLEDYNIEDAYTKDEIEERDLNFIEPTNTNKIILKNKTYSVDGVNVEVSDWNKIHVYTTDNSNINTTISLDALLFGDSRNQLLFLEEIDNSNLSDDILFLKFHYLTTGGSLNYTHDVYSDINNSDAIYIKGDLNPDSSNFNEGWLSITVTGQLDYTFSLRTYDRGYNPETSEIKSTVKIKEDLLKEYNNNINDSIGSLINTSIRKDELYIFSEDNELLSFPYGQGPPPGATKYSLSNASANITTITENSLNKIQINITGNTPITTQYADLVLNQNITLEHGKLYNIIIYCDNNTNNRAVDFTLNAIENNNNVPYKIYHLDNNYDDGTINKINYINDRIYIDSANDIEINNITCTPKAGSTGGTYYISVKPSVGVIKEECLGLERFIENGEVNTLMENYTNASAHKLIGTYQLNNDYCYLAADATFPSNQSPAIYSLPVAAVSNVTTLATGTQDTYKVLIQIQSGDSSTTYIKISPLDGSVTTADTAHFTLCYKYK